MPNLLDILAIDARTFIADFGEWIVYTPLAGSPRRIKAVINRDVASSIEGMLSAGEAYRHEISIINDGIEGAASINKGGDYFAFANFLGGSPEPFIAAKVIHQDEGMWHLGVG